MGSKIVNMCAAGGYCRGVCPEARLLRTKASCPAFYEFVVKPKKEKPKHDDMDLMEE